VTDSVVLERIEPFVARWVETVERPVGSTSMSNPDTSTENKNTEDYDT
jgi:hypothetical protein